MNKANKIARTPPSSCLSNRPAGELFLPALRPVAIIDDQTDDGRAGGATHRFGARGCDRHSPAHRQGRVHLLAAGGASRLRLLSDLPDYHLAGAIIGSGPFVHFITSIRGCRRLADAYGPRHDLPSFVASQLPHFKTSVRYVPKHTDGAVGSDQEAIGVYQNVDC